MGEDNRRRCAARRNNGEPCKAIALAGLDPARCRNHAGKSITKIRAEQAVIVELAKWGLNGHTTMADAGEVLLKLVTQSAARCDLYASLLGQAFTEATAENPDSLDTVMRQSGVGVLIGYRYGVDREGNRFKQEEAIRGLVQLEMQERQFARDAAAKAIAAGLAERQVRLAEAQGMMMVQVIRAVLDDLQLSPDQQQRAGEIVARQLRAISVGAPHSIDSVATEDRP